MAADIEPMPIDRKTVEAKYYRWWLDVCKCLTPKKRQSLRHAISIIEAYRSDMLYQHLSATYKQAARQEGFDRQHWETQYTHALERYMEQDKTRVRRIAVQCPNILICIAGVINGIRRSTDISGAIKAILLLDIIDGTNIDLVAEIELSHIRFLQKSYSVYLPLKEPEIHSVVSIIDSLLKLQPSLHKRGLKKNTRLKTT